MFQVSSTAALDGTGAPEPTIPVVVVNHDDGAGPKVLTIAPRKLLQGQRVLPAVLFIGVGVVAAVQAVDHHQGHTSALPSGLDVA